MKSDEEYIKAAKEIESLKEEWEILMCAQAMKAADEWAEKHSEKNRKSLVRKLAEQQSFK